MLDGVRTDYSLSVSTVCKSLEAEMLVGQAFHLQCCSLVQNTVSIHKEDTAVCAVEGMAKGCCKVLEFVNKIDDSQGCDPV